MHPSAARRATSFHPFTGRDVPWLVDFQARVRPEKIFLVWEPFDGEPQSWTYAQFAEETRVVAAGLSAKGISQGDFVTIHLGNCPEFLFAWYACSRIGAVAVTTNTRSSEEELRYFVDHSGSVAAITQPKFFDLLRRAAPQLHWIACTARDCGEKESMPRPAGVLQFEELRGTPGNAPKRAAEPMLPNSVQYTSGTTARPKGVVWTHANALWCGRVTAAHLELTDDDVHLFYLPLFHTNALAYSVLSTLHSGGTAVMMPRFSATRFWDVAVRNKCTWTSMVMFSLRALEAQPDPERHSFEFWVSGGDLAFVKERWGIKTTGLFGMTETVSQPITYDRHLVAPQMSMGRAAQEYEIVIRRDDGEEVAFGESGRLFVRGVPGVSLFEEYLHDEAATASAFDADGWFDTGDIVTPTADGNIFFAGRAKDMLKVGGENVAAVEIESVVAAVAGVIEVAVVGKPDPMRDEVPVAFVVAQEPGDALRTRILAACERYLADFKRPREVHFVPELPKGILDKVLKKELRARLAEGTPS